LRTFILSIFIAKVKDKYAVIVNSHLSCCWRHVLLCLLILTSLLCDLSEWKL